MRLKPHRGLSNFWWIWRLNKNNLAVIKYRMNNQTRVYVTLVVCILDSHHYAFCQYELKKIEHQPIWMKVKMTDGSAVVRAHCPSQEFRMRLCWCCQIAGIWIEFHPAGAGSSADGAGQTSNTALIRTRGAVFALTWTHFMCACQKTSFNKTEEGTTLFRDRASHKSAMTAKYDSIRKSNFGNV